MTAHQTELAVCKSNLHIALAAATKSSEGYPRSLPLVQRLDNLTKRESWALESIIISVEFVGRYPSITYNSLTRTGIIHLWPIPVRESLLSQFRMAVWPSTTKLPPKVEMNCGVFGFSRFPRFKGKYEDSLDQSSHKCKYKNQDGKLRITAVLEVGFTAQSYAQLVETARMWLEGHDDVQT